MHLPLLPLRARTIRKTKRHSYLIGFFLCTLLVFQESHFLFIDVLAALFMCPKASDFLKNFLFLFLKAFT